jgi:hypothetical protein
MMKLRMNKKLIMGLALAMVLVSGAFINASAECATCFPRINTAVVRPPLNASCQGAFHYGPETPIPMGSIGGAAGG